MTKSKMLLFSLGLLCNFVVQATNQTFSRYRPEDFLFEDGCNKHVEVSGTSYCCLLQVLTVLYLVRYNGVFQLFIQS